jgi:hypothetical protein
MYALIELGNEPNSSKKRTSTLSPRILLGLSATIPSTSDNQPFSIFVVRSSTKVFFFLG